jgi:Ca2+-transporting ATPase
VVLALAVYVPAVRELFRFGPMHADDLAAAFAGAMILLFLFEAIKARAERPAGKKIASGS